MPVLVPLARPGPALALVQLVISWFLVEELLLPVIFSNQSIAKQYVCVTQILIVLIKIAAIQVESEFLRLHLLVCNYVSLLLSPVNESFMRNF